MGHVYKSEIVNVVDNNFSADSRDKDGKRVVTFDARRSIIVYLFPPHIVQIEAVRDSKDGAERGIVSMSSGLRYITARGAAQICDDLGKAA